MTNLLRSQIYKLFHNTIFWGGGRLNYLLGTVLCCV